MQIGHLARFLSYIDSSGGPDACWEWQMGTNDTGYGIYGTGEKRVNRVHRLMWELVTGQALPSWRVCVCHRCDNRKCCNPAHLFIGERLENNEDMRRKGRDFPPPHRVGAANNKAKLTQEQVVAIRTEYWEGLPPKRKGRRPFTEALAQRYGIDRSQVNNIVARRQWRHVPEQEGAVPNVPL